MPTRVWCLVLAACLVQSSAVKVDSRSCSGSLSAMSETNVHSNREHSFRSDAPVCNGSQRVGNGDWWSWRDRLVGVAGKHRSLWAAGDPAVCLRALGGLRWVQAVDGWAQAAWGPASVLIFNGSLESKNQDEANDGDFIGDQEAMLLKMSELGDAPLQAADLNVVNSALNSRQHLPPECASTFDPMNIGSNAAAACHRSHLSADIQAHQLRDLDPALYDSYGRRYPESQNDSARFQHRLSRLQRYLDDYNEVIANLKPDEHVKRLKALAQLAWRYAWLHPFCDGNGRTRTLLVQRELCRLGYHPVTTFDNNFELFYATLPILEEQFVEALLLWEDAYAFGCIPWTPELARRHRFHFGAERAGLPEACSAENQHRASIEASPQSSEARPEG